MSTDIKVFISEEGGYVKIVRFLPDGSATVDDVVYFREIDTWMSIDLEEDRDTDKYASSDFTLVDSIESAAEIILSKNEAFGQSFIRRFI